ncbi:putative Transcription initiation factor IID, 31kD subunit [Monocercomonoides exilis]|uniref:putative Transcription initiation factor IID, 31kD subunit n=1 Tax=Monocercomonoides exilis TaxID=2049356 RepID=UPI003559390D|nr:putative Transcription initiation factor IID, 31kD subunit [Monocercomonoides exilis]|eukprot:MONOS_1792.1-p1 / transcript=MONOS_1792.1 / gene=MONOS_1792 / organism=Monocercomonoides_exilis_PA203 / gene_product=unspecified product / transcript_product=unspecified product / location=Mono_scaffold00033:172917-173606(-) / protein_length=211 / sequence_SO=supercontig / SO=protein_coding / is_pseudo=false
MSEEKEFSSTASQFDNLLSDCGVSQIDEGVYGYCAEFVNRFCRTTLETCYHLKGESVKEGINANDIDFALHFNKKPLFRAQDSFDELASLAETVNSQLLPQCPDSESIILPEDNFCIYNDDYQINTVTAANQAKRAIDASLTKRDKSSSKSSKPPPTFRPAPRSTNSQGTMGSGGRTLSFPSFSSPHSVEPVPREVPARTPGGFGENSFPS